MKKAAQRKSRFLSCLMLGLYLALVPGLPIFASSMTSSGLYANSVHPSPSTDNAIARFNGTTGDLQNTSQVTIDDNGQIISTVAGATDDAFECTGAACSIRMNGTGINIFLFNLSGSAAYDSGVEWGGVAKISATSDSFLTLKSYVAGKGTKFVDTADNLLVDVTDDGTTGYINPTSTKQVGTISLSGGTGTATVFSGALCTCTDATAVQAVQCVVASTTLTATGNASDSINYTCL